MFHKLIPLIFVIILIPTILYSATYTLYFANAKENNWGDYTYSKKIPKKHTLGIPYYAITYINRRIINSEKHYDSDGKVFFIAKHIYDPEIYTKIDILIPQRIIKVKSRSYYTIYYQKIKYLNIISKNKKKLFKAEIFHSNGKIKIINYYDEDEHLTKQEIFNIQGKQIETHYFSFVNGKSILIKTEKP